LVESAVSDHGEENVEPAPGEADDRGVVFLVFGTLPVVIGL